MCESGKRGVDGGIFCLAPLDEEEFLLYSDCVKHSLSAAVLLVSLALIPIESRASEPFDSEEPFKQAITKNLLRSFLNQALDVLGDHLEVVGSLSPDQKQGDRQQYLKFRFYPEGKSKSNESMTAEGWIDQAPYSSQQDFHFRFSLPTPAQNQGPSQSLDVL